MRLSTLIGGGVAAAAVAIAAVFFLQDAAPPLQPASAAVGTPAAPPPAAPAPAAPAASTAAAPVPLTPEQAREQFSAAVAAASRGDQPPAAAQPRPGETPMEFLQRLDLEARKQSADTKSPFGAPPSAKP